MSSTWSLSKLKAKLKEVNETDSITRMWGGSSGSGGTEGRSANAKLSARTQDQKSKAKAEPKPNAETKTKTTEKSADKGRFIQTNLS